MRTLATLFCLGTLALTGCAEGLTGPEADFTPVGPAAQTIDVEAIPPVAEPDIFTTWTGEDAKMSFTLRFSRTELSTMSASDFAFVGTGVCAGDILSPEASNDACRVASGLISEGNLYFEIEQDGAAVAKVVASPDEDFVVLKAQIAYADGSTSEVNFERGPSIF